ncbi:unnamed protein product [Linum trigynum]|uniref:Uncharacterized protein n=1 Tax=Linum trigynum TaxID=586398 RepID=A0AAV2F814_9ROSI
MNDGIVDLRGRIVGKKEKSAESKGFGEEIGDIASDGLRGNRGYKGKTTPATRTAAVNAVVDDVDEEGMSEEKAQMASSNMQGRVFLKWRRRRKTPWSSSNGGGWVKCRGFLDKEARRKGATGVGLEFRRWRRRTMTVDGIIEVKKSEEMKTVQD